MRRFGIQFLLLMFFLLTSCLSTGSAATAEMMPELSATGFTAAPDANEKAWLEAHPVLRVGGPKAFLPFHFFDDAGNPQGMASDYLRLLMEKTGLKTDVPKNPPWPEVLKKAREKEIDLITCAAITPERESYLLFSKPYLSFPLVIISRKDSPFIGGIGDLQGMKMAFVTDNVVYEWMWKDRIDMAPHFVSTPLDALKAVSLGRADAHIDNLAAASFLIEKYGLANLKIAAPTPYQNYTLHVAVRKDWPELVTIISPHQPVSNWLETRGPGLCLYCGNRFRLRNCRTGNRETVRSIFYHQIHGSGPGAFHYSGNCPGNRRGRYG